MIKVGITTKPQTFPAGTTAGQFSYSMTGSNGYTGQQLGDANGVTFSDANAPGDYTCVVQLQAADGSPLGSPMSGSVSILQPTGVSIDVPDTITLTVA